jgi:hypothetical protein
MNRLAELQQLLAAGPRYNSGFDPYGVLDHANRMNAENNAGAMMMQQRMQEQEGGESAPPPDFFAGEPPRNALAAFRRPQPMDPMRMPPRQNSMPRPNNMLAYYGGR